MVNSNNEKPYTISGVITNVFLSNVDSYRCRLLIKFEDKRVIVVETKGETLTYYPIKLDTINKLYFDGYGTLTYVTQLKETK